MAPQSTQSRSIPDKPGIRDLLKGLGHSGKKDPMYEEFQDFIKTFVSSEGLRGTDIIHRRDQKHIVSASEMVTAFLQQPKEGHASLGHCYWPGSTAGVRSGLPQFPKDSEKIEKDLASLCFCKNEQRNKNEAQRHKKRAKPSNPQNREGSRADQALSDDGVPEPSAQPSTHRHVPQTRSVEAQTDTASGPRDNLSPESMPSASREATERRGSVESFVDRIRHEVEEGAYIFGDSDADPFEDLPSPCPEVARAPTAPMMASQSESVTHAAQEPSVTSADDALLSSNEQGNSGNADIPVTAPSTPSRGVRISATEPPLTGFGWSAYNELRRSSRASKKRVMPDDFISTLNAIPPDSGASFLRNQRPRTNKSMVSPSIRRGTDVETVIPSTESVQTPIQHEVQPPTPSSETHTAQVVQPRRGHVSYFIERKGCLCKWVPSRAFYSLTLAEFTDEVFSSTLDEAAMQVDGFRFSLSGIAKPQHMNVLDENEFAYMKEMFHMFIKEKQASIAASPNKANRPTVILIRLLEKDTGETGIQEEDDAMEIW